MIEESRKVAQRLRELAYIKDELVLNGFANVVDDLITELTKEREYSSAIERDCKAAELHCKDLIAKVAEYEAVMRVAQTALSLALSDVEWRKDSPTQPVIHKAYNKLQGALHDTD